MKGLDSFFENTYEEKIDKVKVKDLFIEKDHVFSTPKAENGLNAYENAICNNFKDVI